jgi:hypothetical protein
MTVQITPAARLHRVNITLDRLQDLAARGATFTGLVVDSTNVPIANAEVAFPDLAKSVTSDVRGAFRFTGIPSGTHHVVVRRIGYGAMDTQLQVTGHESIERRVVLGRTVTIETMVVTSQADARRMADFEDNRRAGLGQFMTRVELEKFDGMDLRTPLQTLRGLGFISANAHFYPIKTPQPSAICIPDPPRYAKYTPCMTSRGYYVPADGADGMSGIVVACYSQVYVDGVLMNHGTPTPPYDLKEIPVNRVAAVEYYNGGSETPARYMAGAASPCGVVVVTTR